MAFKRTTGKLNPEDLLNISYPKAPIRVDMRTTADGIPFKTYYIQIANKATKKSDLRTKSIPVKFPKSDETSRMLEDYAHINIEKAFLAFKNNYWYIQIMKYTVLDFGEINAKNTFESPEDNTKDEINYL